jgi:thiol-disulfide isomerase/thioredoxin
MGKPLFILLSCPFFLLRFYRTFRYNPGTIPDMADTKKRSSILPYFILLGMAISVFAADEIELPDGTKFEADVMLYKTGRLMMIKKDGSRVVMAITDIKRASFEPPAGSFMPIIFPGGQRGQAMVQDYDEGFFNLLTMEGADKSLRPNEIAAIQFRTKSTIASDAAETEARKSEDPKVKEAANKRISDEDLAEVPATLSVELPKKIIEGIIDQLELRAELEALNNDFEGGKKTDSRIKKVNEEIKKMNLEVSLAVRSMTEKNSKELERCKKDFEKLEEKQLEYAKRDKDIEPILAEKAKVEALLKQHTDIKNALNWNCTRLDNPHRDSAWTLVGRPAPTTELYVFGKGRAKLDKTSREGVTVYTFWSTKNRDSQKMLPALANLSRAYARDPLHIYTINLGDNMETLKKVMPKLPRQPRLHHAIAVKDAKGKSANELYRAMLIPSTYIIDQEGKVYALHIAGTSKVLGLINEDLEALLKKPAEVAAPRRR